MRYLIITTTTTNIQTSVVSLGPYKVPDWSLHQSPIKLLLLSNQHYYYTVLMKPLFLLKNLWDSNNYPIRHIFPQLSIQTDAKAGQSLKKKKKAMTSSWFHERKISELQVQSPLN